MYIFLCPVSLIIFNGSVKKKKSTIKCWREKVNVLVMLMCLGHIRQHLRVCVVGVNVKLNCHKNIYLYKSQSRRSCSEKSLCDEWMVMTGAAFSLSYQEETSPILLQSVFVYWTLCSTLPS